MNADETQMALPDLTGKHPERSSECCSRNAVEGCGFAARTASFDFGQRKTRWPPLKMLQGRLKRRGEIGQIAVMLVVLLPVLLALAGLVVDGGIMFVNYRLGRVTVDSAALVAATMLDERVFEDSNEVRLKNEAAYEIAMHYAAVNGQGRVAITGVNVSENMVTVYGSVVSPTIFMRIFNVDHVTFNLLAEAELKYGITEENQ